MLMTKEFPLKRKGYMSKIPKHSTKGMSDYKECHIKPFKSGMHFAEIVMLYTILCEKPPLDAKVLTGNS